MRPNSKRLLQVWKWILWFMMRCVISKADIYNLKQHLPTCFPFKACMRQTANILCRTNQTHQIRTNQSRSAISAAAGQTEGKLSFYPGMELWIFTEVVGGSASVILIMWLMQRREGGQRRTQRLGAHMACMVAAGKGPKTSTVMSQEHAQHLDMEGLKACRPCRVMTYL